MEEMVAYCGIVCTECPAYIATQNDDAEELKRVSEMWSNEEWQLKPEAIICDGCLPGHTRYALFCPDCETRSCAIARAVANCAHCDGYACEKLARTFEMVPEAKAKLDEIRGGL